MKNATSEPELKPASEVICSFFENHGQKSEFLTGTAETPDFFEAFKIHEVRPIKNGTAFNFTEFLDKKSRKLENIQRIGGIILDIDNITSDVVSALKAHLKGIQSICYTTFSHTKSAPRLRVALPVNMEIPQEELRGYVERVAAFLNVQVDKCSYNPVQMYYFPSHPEQSANEGHFIQTVINADRIDPRALPPTKKKSRSASGNSKSDRESGNENQIALADKVIENEFDSNVQAVAGEVFSYERGVWLITGDDVLGRRLSEIPYVAESCKTTAQIEGVLRAVKMRRAVKEFPEATVHTINVENGILDLTTGELEPHSPDHYHRNQLATPYSEEAKCPRWLRFLDEIFEGDPDQQGKITFLQEWFGYLLVPSTQHQKMLWLLGTGANGKSALLEVMQDMLGMENTSSMMLDEMSKEFHRHELYGKLANFSGELPAGARLNDGFIKSVVAGDSITANRKNRNPVQFRPYARLIAAMNELPTLKDLSHGFFRRLIVLTFNRTFKREEQDLNLSAALKSERAGIFAWAVKGLFRLQEQERFTTVPSSEHLCQQYRRNSDPIQMFLDECVLLHPGFKTKKKDVYDAYRSYCVANGYVPESNVTFGKQLKSKGIKDAASNGSSYYLLNLLASASAGQYGSEVVVPAKRMTLEDAMNDDDRAA